MDLREVPVRHVKGGRCTCPPIGESVDSLRRPPHTSASFVDLSIKGGHAFKLQLQPKSGLERARKNSLKRNLRWGGTSSLSGLNILDIVYAAEVTVSPCRTAVSKLCGRG